MKDNAQLEDVRKEIRYNQTVAPYLSQWKHVKSGDTYTVRMHVIIEATLQPAVVYYKPYADSAETWVRPASEFFDGRFERIHRKGEEL